MVHYRRARNSDTGKEKEELRHLGRKFPDFRVRRSGFKPSSLTSQLVKC